MHSKTLIKVRFAVLLILFSIVQLSCQRAGLNSESLKINSHSEKVEDDLEFEEQTQNRARCMSASVE